MDQPEDSRRALTGVHSTWHCTPGGFSDGQVTPALPDPTRAFEDYPAKVPTEPCSNRRVGIMIASAGALGLTS